MKIDSISLHNILSHGDMDGPIVFTDERLWLICGENGAGKSALFDGLEYALYGRHRGGGDEVSDNAHSQQAELLVKQGESDASIEVVLRLGSKRYRVTRYIRAQGGNQGGDVHELRDDGREELIPTGGRQGAWSWLRSNGLPPYELFRSAIYLRQGHAAHFLRGSSTDRVNRFAMLLDLSRYTELSRSAKRRKEAAATTRERLTGARAELGDVSDGALDTLNAELTTLSERLQGAEKLLVHATTVRAGAEHIARLEDQQGKLLQRKQELQILRADEVTIRADHNRVLTWDRSVGRLTQYWETHERGGKARAEALKHLRAADGYAAGHATDVATLTERQKERDALSLVVVPDAVQKVKAAEQRVAQLKLELDIARSCSNIQKAQEGLVSLVGALEVLADCQARDGELHWLKTLAERRATADKMAASVPGLERGALQREADIHAAEDFLARMDVAVAAAQATRDATATSVQEGAQQLASLSGRISGHKGLQGDEHECPVCAQSLDDVAYKHLRSVLADELAKQDELQTSLVEVKKRYEQERKAASTAVEKQTAAREECRRCERENAKIRAELNAAIDARTQAHEALATARADAQQHCTRYASLLDSVTVPWHKLERERFVANLVRAEERAKEFRIAEHALNATETNLRTLCGRRAEGAEPLGDTTDPDGVQSALQYALAQVEVAEKHLRRSETELLAARNDCEKLAERCARLEEQHKAEEAQARGSVAAAKECDDLAAGIRIELDDQWRAELDDRDVYVAAKTDVEARRQSAARYDELLQSGGAVLQVQADLNRIATQIESSSPEHRVPVDDARAAEIVAAEQVQTTRQAHDRTANDQNRLMDRRERDRKYRRQIDEAATEAETFGTLADLLAEGGAIQTRIVEEMQKEIVHEVNTVLEKLGDGLRVRLGEPRRSKSIQLKDLVFADERDPRGHARHYQFLSGGEQFRIALALALALHRRVGHVPGTIIIDEGFGALDGSRRDALAHQMTDTSQGILSLGLAESVIICSHNEDVQARFPHRWYVHKQGGTATVERQDDEGDAG